MKFSYKIMLCCIVTMAVAFGIGGYCFVNNVFETSLERETGQAMDESSILKFAFETAALNTPAKYGILSDSAIEEIGRNLEKSGQNGSRLLRLSDENRQVLYVSEGFAEDREWLATISEGSLAYQVICLDAHYYVQTGMMIGTLNRTLTLETMRDVTAVYQERERGFAVYRNLTLALLGFSTVLMGFFAAWLTRPIRCLTQATQKMTAGDYSCRAEQMSDDEMGQLTSSFNHMAGVVEANIHALEEEVRAREDFIAAFSHELKTPLTAVIGYADILRSRSLDEEKHFLAANYIYTEGRRLESMSLRLMEIIAAKRCELDPQTMDVEMLFGYLRDMFEQKEENPLVFHYEPGYVRGEGDLLKTVLLNLADNACKASSPGSPVEIIGENRERGYWFAVKDSGVGIPLEEIRRITEAFYMVDKSRSRSHNGAGLGLALCAELLKLHGSVLEVESRPKEGSCFSFLISYEEVKEDEEAKSPEYGSICPDSSDSGDCGAGTGTDSPL